MTDLATVGTLVLMPSGRRALVEAQTPDGDLVLRYRTGDREAIEASAAFVRTQCIRLKQNPSMLADHECQMPARVTRIRMRQTQED